MSTPTIRYGGGPIFSQSVTRLRATRLRDDSGALTPQSDWANATSTVLAGVSVQPVATSEVRDAAGIAQADEWILYGPRGAKVDLQLGDRVLWDGRTLDVIGVPQSWPGLLAGWHHSEIHLKASPPTRLPARGAAAVQEAADIGAMLPQRVWTP